MRIGIIQFPGSNCERETILAVKRAGMEAIEFLWNDHREKLTQLDGYVLVGGFSYEDRSRAGIIAALDPVMSELKVQSELGKPILGICNGAQILVETGLVPGVENNKVVLALTENKRISQGKILGTGYYNSWIHMRLSDQYQRNAFTKYLTPTEILTVPVAHAQGRFLMSQALLEELTMQGLHVFQYCDEQGTILDEFPVNPNGSMLNIAAIANKQGNVLAMMPHPERTTNGDAIFKSMRDYISQHKTNPTPPLYYYPRARKLPTYQSSHEQWLVALKITDNHAATVQQRLRQLGFAVTVKRYDHWEIASTDRANLAAILKSEVLYNERKEVLVKPSTLAAQAFLVRAKEDLYGQEKHQILRDFYAIQGVNKIQHGVLWQFSGENINIDALLQTNIINNPYAHDCYQYQSALP